MGDATFRIVPSWDGRQHSRWPNGDLPPPPPPETPQLSVIPVWPESVRISVVGGPAIGALYTLFRRRSEGGEEEAVLTAQSLSEPYVDENLGFGETYEYAIFAENQWGSSLLSDWVSVTTGPEAFTPLFAQNFDSLPSGGSVVSFSNNGGKCQVNCAQPHGLATGASVRIVYGSPMADRQGNYSRWAAGSSGASNPTVSSIVSATSFVTSFDFVGDDSAGWSYLRWGRTVSGTGITNGSYGIITDEEAFTAGGNSLKCQIGALDGESAHGGNGDGGYNEWGFAYQISAGNRKYLGEGMWARVRIRWPGGFRWTSPGHRLKLLRFDERGGPAFGHIDTYINGHAGATTPSTPTYACIKEAADSTWQMSNGPHPVIPTDQWVTYEMFARLDTLRSNEGGVGHFRMWVDGEPVFDRPMRTLTTPTGYINRLLVGTYWNGPVPQSQHCYIDDLIIATSDSPPINLDASGNPYIGL